MIKAVVNNLTNMVKFKFIYIFLLCCINNISFSVIKTGCPSDFSKSALQNIVSIHNKTFGKDNLIINKFESKDWNNLMKCIGNLFEESSNLREIFQNISQQSDDLISNLTVAFRIFAVGIKDTSKKNKGFSSLDELKRNNVDFKKINLNQLEKVKNNLELLKSNLQKISKKLSNDISIRSSAKSKKEILINLNNQFLMTAVEKAIKDIVNLNKKAYSEAIRV